MKSTAKSQEDEPSSKYYKQVIEKVLDQHKAEDIISIDISKKSNLADYMIIASGKSDIHVKALAEYLKKEIRDYGKLQMDGEKTGNWVVITFKNILVHIFRPEVREYYKLEELWNNSSVKFNTEAIDANQVVIDSEDDKD